MGTLTSLLRAKTEAPSTTDEKVVKSKKPHSLMEKKGDAVVSPKVEAFDFHISDEDLQKVRDSVVPMDTEGRSKYDIILGMYGNIKDPRTGKSFVIPGVDFSSDDYMFQYAEMMRLLVKRPEEFKKIMNWE